MTIIDTTKVLKIIKQIVNDNVELAELNWLIFYCQALSKSCLISEIQFGRLDLNHSLINQDQIDDFALDCIADLFARNDQEKYFLLIRFFEPQIDSLTQTPERILPVLRKLISSRVHQSLITHFSKVDQGGWKIWRNLNLATKRQPRLNEFTFLNQSYIFLDHHVNPENTQDRLNPRVNPIPDDQLSNLFLDCFKTVYGLPQILIKVLEEIRTHSDYQQFLSRSQVYKVLKDLLNINYMDVEEIDTLMSFETSPDETQQELSAGVKGSEIHRYVSDQLNARYLDKGKIDKTLFKSYYAVLKLYFSDLIEDGFTERLPKYLDTCGSKNLESDDWLLHRGRLEYIIKLGKSHIRELIKADDFSNNIEMRV